MAFNDNDDSDNGGAYPNYSDMNMLESMQSPHSFASMPDSSFAYPMDSMNVSSMATAMAMNVSNELPATIDRNPMMKQIRDPLSLYISQQTHLSTTSPTSWRTRDPIYALLHKREMLQKILSSEERNIDMQNSPPKGKQFPIEEALLQLKCEEKLSVIHRAFDAAAFSVLRAVQKQGRGNCSSSIHNEEGPLPPLLRTLKQLDQAKKDSLDIVSHKRKGQTASPAVKKQKLEEKKQVKKDKKDAPSVQLAGYSNLDSRSTLSRAILCAAASLSFKQLTPKFDHLEDISVLDVPQNPDNDLASGEKAETEKNKDKPEINMGAVTMSAEIFAKRTVEQVHGATMRGEKRRRWRMDCARSDLVRKERELCLFNSNPLEQFLSWKDLNVVTESDTDDDDGSFDGLKQKRFVRETRDEEWSKKCLPRLLEIMSSGPGHVVLHDLQWRSRADRILQLLRGLVTDTRCNGGNGVHTKEPNFGCHLIITTESDLDTFMGVLGPLNYSLSGKVADNASFQLRGLRYDGSVRHRRRMRMDHFTSVGLSGLPDTPYNVIVTTYKTFIQDYLHLCQIPFQSVVLDDGMSWLGTAHFDPNGQLGKAFDMAMWSKSDNHAGLAGVRNEKWDFSLDVAPDGTIIKPIASESTAGSQLVSCSLVGLTARHRVLIASSMHSTYRDVLYSAPVPALLSFLLPQFADVVREEWDRSRIHACEKSMDHVRKLLCRGIVVYTGSDSTKDLFSLAMSGMAGAEEVTSLCNISRGDESDPDMLGEKIQSVSTDKMISDGKIVQSRRLAATWLRVGSPIRQELGTIAFGPIVNAFKTRSSTGYVCEEIVTASSITVNGAGGAIAGPSAYKTAVRCGRKFGSEQGLRQHIAALHAPPGTWLCRSCAVDCGTSQARTHHERSCASNATGKCRCIGKLLYLPQ